MNTSKSLQDLNLIDAFLFSASTENPRNAELIARIIIERVIGKKVKKISVMPEKQLLGIDIRHHGIRMDVCITECEADNIVRVYDIEPNKYDLEELPRRSRYYQALADVKLLETGKSYKNLPEYISIWILPEDPFGRNQMIYTVKNVVAEDAQIEYNDGVKKLFLYTDGQIGGSEALGNLLQYFAQSSEENALDSDLQQLHTIVKATKSNQKVGERYMTLQEMIDYEKAAAQKEGREEGRKEGREEGRKESISVLIRTCRKIGASDLQIVESIMEEYHLSQEEAKECLSNQ